MYLTHKLYLYQIFESKMCNIVNLCVIYYNSQTVILIYIIYFILNSVRIEKAIGFTFYNYVGSFHFFMYTLFGMEGV